MDTLPALSERSKRLTLLLSRVALGDRVAFDTLYRETSAHLLGSILRIQKNRDQAEEVLQEVYVNVWRAAQSFNPAAGQASTWLNSVARHRAIDSRRRRQTEPSTVSRHQGGPDSEESDMLENLPCEAPGPLDLLQQACEERALKDCMAELSNLQQQSLALAYFEGLTHVEVAAHMGQPLGSVKSWVRRALQRLKACLERAALVVN